MTIYVNELGTKFIKAENCSTKDRIMLYKQLKDKGYQLPFNVCKGDDNGYIQLNKFLKKHLTLYQKVQLCNLITKLWMINPINIKVNYERYMCLHAGNKDYGYKEFLKELETGNEAILESCNERLDNINTYKEYCVVFNYLNSIENPKHWHSWHIMSLGKDSWVWFYDDSCEHDFDRKFTDDKLDSFCNIPIEEILKEALYGACVSLKPCNNKGICTHDQEDSPRVVAGLYIGINDSLSNKSEESVDEYMLKEYDMRPAHVDVTYKL